MKQMLFLCVASAIQLDCEWAKLYERLVPKKCAYDERTQRYRGKVKVMGRIAGQMIDPVKTGCGDSQSAWTWHEPPDPILYDPEIHRRHRNGAYCPLTNALRQSKIIRLPERSLSAYSNSGLSSLRVSS